MNSKRALPVPEECPWISRSVEFARVWQDSQRQIHYIVMDMPTFGPSIIAQLVVDTAMIVAWKYATERDEFEDEAFKRIVKLVLLELHRSTANLPDDEDPA